MIAAILVVVIGALGIAAAIHFCFEAMKEDGFM